MASMFIEAAWLRSATADTGGHSLSRPAGLPLEPARWFAVNFIGIAGFRGIDMVTCQAIWQYCGVSALSPGIPWGIRKEAFGVDQARFHRSGLIELVDAFLPESRSDAAAVARRSLRRLRGAQQYNRKQQQ